MLNNNLNKMEIAGIIAGGISVAAGLGIAVYAHFKCKKESKEIEQVEENVEDTEEILNDILNETRAMED